MQVIQISAKPGDPSTLWKSDSGKYYATKREAVNDSGTELNPDDYEIKTSWLRRNWKTVSISAGVFVVLAVAIYCVWKYYLKK